MWFAQLLGRLMGLLAPWVFTRKKKEKDSSESKGIGVLAPQRGLIDLKNTLIDLQILERITTVALSTILFIATAFGASASGVLSHPVSALAASSFYLGLHVVNHFYGCFVAHAEERVGVSHSKQ